MKITLKTSRLEPSRLPTFGLRGLLLVSLVFGALLLPSFDDRPLAQEGSAFKVVVNNANPASAESKSTLSKIFLKKVREWDNKEKVNPYDLDEKSEARKAFSDAVHGKSVSAIKSYWQRMIFSGRDVPPDEVASEADVLKKVAADKGAIGYVAAKTPLPDGVKELKVKDE